MSDSMPPSLGDVVATLKRADGTECQGLTRTLTLNSMTVVIESNDLNPDEGVRATQCARLKSSSLDTELDVICQVQGHIEQDGQTTLRLRILDWIGLREQLPTGVRELFSLREHDRFEPKVDEPVQVHFNHSNDKLDERVKMFDLSMTGVAVLAPAVWFDRVDAGDEVKVGFKLPDQPYTEMFGVVRHVHFEDAGMQAGLSWENRRLLVGVAFDPDVTPDFTRKHQPIRDFLEQL